MLTKIKLCNFTSFKNETEIDFTKTGYQLLQDNVYNGVLKGGVFVGANASGKSNILLALQMLLDMLFYDGDVKFVRVVSLLNPHANTMLEYHFLFDKQTVVYKIEFDFKQIIKEDLLLEGQPFFQREKADVWYMENGQKLQSEVDPTILFLRRLYFNTKFRGNALLISLMEFIKNSIYLNPCTNKIGNYSGKNFKVMEYLKHHNPDNLNEALKEYGIKSSIAYEAASGESEGDDSKEEGKAYFVKDGVSPHIPYRWESLGTRTLVKTLPPFEHAIHTNCMLIIDEFSSGLHNELEARLIQNFMKESSGSQLFLVSHSTNILTNQLLRPDQIYAVEYKEREGSRVNRFSDGQPRAAQNLEKMYLGGVFGGLPEYDDVAKG